MFYEFQKNTHIDDYLDAIKGIKGFSVSEKDWFNVISYVAEDSRDLFANPNETGIVDKEKTKRILRRECRGLVFDKRNGEMLSRGYHKFFNVNENDEMQHSAIDISQPHLILDKLDGSMVRPIYSYEFNGFRLATKKGITSVAMEAEVYIATHVKYFKFIRAMWDFGYVPIFEFLDAKKIIVIQHTETTMILTGIRDLEGNYISYDEMCQYANRYDIPVVKAYGEVNDLLKFVNDTRPLIGIEGFIVRFDNGHMFKIKTEEYFKLHYIADLYNHERKVWQIIIDNALDDIKAAAQPDVRKAYENIEKNFFNIVRKIEFGAQSKAEQFSHMSLKEFAKYFEERKSKKNRDKNFELSLVFNIKRGNSIRDDIIQYLHKHTGTAYRVEELKNKYLTEQIDG